MKSYKNETITDFDYEGLSPEKTACQSHLIMLIDLVYRSDQSYYPQGLLEDYEDKISEKIVKHFITEDLTDSDSVSVSENDNTYEDELGIDEI